MTGAHVMDLFSYPQSPGFKSTDTSAAAADAIGESAPRLRQMCLDHLRRFGELTADEIADGLRIDKLSIRPRLSELRRLGRVADSGTRRRNASDKRAIVWKVVP